MQDFRASALLGTWARGEVGHMRFRAVARDFRRTLSRQRVYRMASSKMRRKILWGGFFAAVVALGLSYWRVRYGTVNLPEALYSPALAVIAIASALAVALGAAGFWRSVLVFGSAAPTTVAVRVLVEGIADPTSHNLWPFEIVIAYGVGLPFAIGGAVVGWLIAWSQKRQ